MPAQHDNTLAAWLKLASADDALPAHIKEVVRARMVWMVPYAQTFLTHLLSGSNGIAAHCPADLISPPWSKDRYTPCPAVSAVPARRMHGHLERAPFACAIAVPLLPAIEQAHLILLAAALAVHAAVPDAGARWYTVGLVMRKLAEPTRSGAAGYSAPFDLDEVDDIGNLLRRLDALQDEDGNAADGFTPVDSEVQYAAELRHLRALLSNCHKVCLRMGTTHVSAPRTRSGIRGPQRDAAPLGFAWRPQAAQGNQDEDLPAATWRIAEATESNDDLDAVISGVGPLERADAEALIEQVIPPSLPREEQRQAVQSALACQLVDLAPNIELDDTPESMFAATRRVDPCALVDWRRALRALPRPARRWGWVGLILTVVLGIEPDHVRRLPLRLAARQRLSGLRFWRSPDGQIGAELSEPITPVHQRFAASLCTPSCIAPTSDWRVITVHPVVARWLAELLQSLGAQWTPQGLRPPPGRWRPKRHLDALCSHVARGPGLPIPRLGHLGGLHLAAIRASGIFDPATIRLLTPSLVIRVTPPIHYTRVTTNELQALAEAVQVTAWTWLTRRRLTLPQSAGVADGVGSLRCATTLALGHAERILHEDVRRAGECVHNAEAAAECVNAAVSRLVLQFTARYGLRARGPLWGSGLHLCAAHDYWTINDKGQHRRTLPLDAPERALVQELGQIFERAAHPTLGADAVDALRVASRNLLHGGAGADALTLGQLSLQHRTWQWRELAIADIEARLARGGLLFTLQAIRHWARSTLVRLKVPPERIAFLLGHHGYMQEEFRPFRHTSGPLLKVNLSPLIRQLQAEAGL